MNMGSGGGVFNSAPRGGIKEKRIILVPQGTWYGRKKMVISFLASPANGHLSDVFEELSKKLPECKISHWHPNCSILSC